MVSPTLACGVQIALGKTCVGHDFLGCCSDRGGRRPSASCDPPEWVSRLRHRPLRETHSDRSPSGTRPPLPFRVPTRRPPPQCCHGRRAPLSYQPQLMQGHSVHVCTSPPHPPSLRPGRVPRDRGTLRAVAVPSPLDTGVCQDLLHPPPICAAHAWTPPRPVGDLRWRDRLWVADTSFATGSVRRSYGVSPAHRRHTSATYGGDMGLHPHHPRCFGWVYVGGLRSPMSVIGGGAGPPTWVIGTCDWRGLALPWPPPLHAGRPPFPGSSRLWSPLGPSGGSPLGSASTHSRVVAVWAASRFCSPPPRPLFIATLPNTRPVLTFSWHAT